MIQHLFHSCNLMQSTQVDHFHICCYANTLVRHGHFVDFGAAKCTLYYAFYKSVYQILQEVISVSVLQKLQFTFSRLVLASHSFHDHFTPRWCSARLTDNVIHLCLPLPLALWQIFHMVQSIWAGCLTVFVFFQHQDERRRLNSSSLSAWLSRGQQAVWCLFTESTKQL